MFDFWKRFRRDRLAVYSLGVIGLFVAAAILAGLLAPYDPSQQFFDGLTLEGSPLPPSARFWFGTDTNGRDQFSRLLYGAQTSLLIGIVANGIAVFIGAGLGLVAGYVRGFVGSAIMRFTDLMMAFPPLLLAIALAAILKPGLNIVILVIALVNWVQIARVIYAETVALSEREYIEAARAMGAGTGRILLRHLLPHLVPTVIVYATLGIATDCAARSHALVPWSRGATAHAGLGHDDLRKPVLFSQCPVAGVHPGRRNSHPGPVVQPRRRWVAGRA